MTLDVTTVPNPPAGQDWSVPVPGHQLWDVVGVVATLATTVPVTLKDVSGNNNNGTYQTILAGYPQFPAGLVAGDTSVLTGSNRNSFTGAYGTVPHGIITWTGNWTVEMWMYCPAAQVNPQFLWTVGGAPFNWEMYCQVIQSGADYYIMLDDGQGRMHFSNLVAITTGAAHMFAVKLTAGVLSFFIDGVNIGVSGGGAYLNPPTAATVVQIGETPFTLAASGANLDEWAIYGTAVSDARIAAHYAAASTSFAAYTAAVLADSPAGYWHLDNNGSATGRTPSLVITDGTHVVDQIGQGFTAVSTAGPYTYSWQPNVAANTVTPSGQNVSVAIPKLALPAGYVIETITPDLVATDQWSNIAVWWSDDLQDLLLQLNAYEYPPGAFLQYQQQGATP